MRIRLLSDFEQIVSSSLELLYFRMEVKTTTRNQKNKKPSKMRPKHHTVCEFKGSPVDIELFEDALHNKKFPQIANFQFKPTFRHWASLRCMEFAVYISKTERAEWRTNRLQEHGTRSWQMLIQTHAELVPRTKESIRTDSSPAIAC